MCPANPRWGAPQIHGEFLMIAIAVSQATVAKYMVRHPKPPKTWFLQTSSWSRRFLCDGHVPLSVDVLKGNRMEEGYHDPLIGNCTAQRANVESAFDLGTDGSFLCPRRPRLRLPFRCR